MTLLLVSALLMGLLGGVHCVSMCGGVAATLCSATGRGDGAVKTPVLLGYNTGRVLGYSLLGALAGGLGSLASGLGPLFAAQLALRLVAAVLLVGVGLWLAGLWSGFARIERLGRPAFQKLAPLARALLPARTFGRATALGLCWGFLPCGLVYAALGMAIGAGSALEGAAVMAAFGAGTLPTLLVLGALAHRVLSLARAAWLRRAAGVAVLLTGLVHLAGAGSEILRSGVTPRLEAPPPCCAPPGE